MHSSYNGQLRVELILIFRPHNLVQVVGSRKARWDAIILLEDRDIRVTLLRQVESCRETKGTTADNDDRIRLGDTHIGGTQDAG